MIDALIAELDELVDTDASTLADSDTILALHRELARLEGVVTRATARWDADKTWASDGAKTGGAWLAAMTHAPRQEMNRRLRLGRALRSLPATEHAWLSGSIGSAHVSALAASRSTERLAAQMTIDEPALIAKAKTMRFRRFERELAYWRQVHDIDGEDDKIAKQVAGRFLHLSQTFQNTWRLDANLDPIAGSIVHDTLRAIERELFEQDWKEARATLGREPVTAELQRTAAQRRADALTEMAIRSRMKPKDGRAHGVRATVTGDRRGRAAPPLRRRDAPRSRHP